MALIPRTYDGRPIPKPMKRTFYVIAHRGVIYFHRGLWPTKADAARNADDLPENEVEIRRCWVAPEKTT
jgi:hypothetical protein